MMLDAKLNPSPEVYASHYIERDVHVEYTDKMIQMGNPASEKVNCLILKDIRFSC